MTRIVFSSIWILIACNLTSCQQIGDGSPSSAVSSLESSKVLIEDLNTNTSKSSHEKGNHILPPLSSTTRDERQAFQAPENTSGSTHEIPSDCQTHDEWVSTYKYETLVNVKPKDSFTLSVKLCFRSTENCTAYTNESILSWKFKVNAQNQWLKFNVKVYSEKNLYFVGLDRDGHLFYKGTTVPVHCHIDDSIKISIHSEEGDWFVEKKNPNCTEIMKTSYTLVPEITMSNSIQPSWDIILIDSNSSTKLPSDEISTGM